VNEGLSENTLQWTIPKLENPPKDPHILQCVFGLMFFTKQLVSLKTIKEGLKLTFFPVCSPSLTIESRYLKICLAKTSFKNFFCVGIWTLQNIEMVRLCGILKIR